MLDPELMVAAVREYAAAFDDGDADRVAALFAVDATVEDPVGSPKHHGRDAIRNFYALCMTTGAKLRLDEPIRVVQDYAVFAFSVLFDSDGPKRIDVIDSFRFNADGKVTEMRAYWGPTNFRDQREMDNA